MGIYYLVSAIARRSWARSSFAAGWAHDSRAVFLAEHRQAVTAAAFAPAGGTVEYREIAASLKAKIVTHGFTCNTNRGARRMSKNYSTVQKADAISLDDEEGVKQVLVNSVLGLWDVVNNLTRLKPSKH